MKSLRAGNKQRGNWAPRLTWQGAGSTQLPPLGGFGRTPDPAGTGANFRRRRRGLVVYAMWLAPRLCAMAAIAALVGLAGSVFDVPVLNRLSAEAAAMHPLTAATILMLCLAAWLYNYVKRRGAAFLAALAAFGITAARLFALAIPAVPGIAYRSDGWLVLDDPGSIAFGANTAAALLAFAVGLMATFRGRPRIGQFLALSALAVALVSAAGYALLLDTFHGAMSPLTTAAILSMSLALAGRTARHGALRAFLSSNTTGRTMRTLFAALLAVLPTFGLVLPRLFLGPESMKWLAINMVAELCILTAVLLAVTARLERRDRRLRHMTMSMRRASHVDPLTGAANRRGLLDRLRDFDRTTESVGILAIDIDHFKAINDAYGHMAGDAVLCELADLLRGGLRATDIVARTGGEEFIVVLHRATLANTVAVAEGLRLQIASHNFRALDGNVRQVTVSIGCAVRMGPGLLAPALNRADQALYAAKRSGRNRVRPLASAPVPQRRSAAA